MRAEQTRSGANVPLDKLQHNKIRTRAKLAWAIPLGLVGGLTTVASATSNSWQSTSAGNWADASSWSGGVNVPGAVSGTSNADTATFNTSSGVGVTVDAYRNIKTILFDGNASTFSIGGGNLYLTSGGAIQLGSTATSFLGANTTETVGGTIYLAGSYSFTNNSTTTSDTLSITSSIFNTTNGDVTLTLNGANGGANTISGVIGNGGARVNLATGGTAKWILSAANTTAGTTTVNANTSLQLNNASALQNSVVTVSAANGLQFNSGIGTFNLAGLGGGSNESLQDTSSGAVTLNLGLYNNSGGTYSGVLSGAGSIVKLGTGTQTFAGNNGYTGGTSLNAGTLASTLATNGTPFGTGSIFINSGTLSLKSGAGVIFQTAANAGAGTQLTYGGGAIVNINKNGGTSLTLTVGNAGATGSVLARSGNGVLIINPTSADLGTNENFVVSGPTPTVLNGMVDPTIVTLGGGTANIGDFVTYGGSFNGFGSASAAYTPRSGTITAGTTGSGEISNINATATFSGNNSTYALLVQSGITGTLNAGVTLSVGDNTAGHQAGVIFNGGTLTGGTINFGADEGIVYAFNGTANLRSSISGTGGLTLAGTQTVALGTGAPLSSNYSGGLNLEGVTLQMTGNNGGASGVVADNTQFGAPTNVITVNGGTINPNSLMLLPKRSVVIGTGGASISGSGNDNFSFSGSGPLTYKFGGNGTGYFLLTGGDFHTGATYFNSGMLGISTLNAINSGPLTFVGSGTPTGLSILGTSITSLSNTLIFDASTGAQFAFDIQSAANTFTLSQKLDFGSSAFYKFGAGNLVLTNAETYSGQTALYGGTLVVDGTQGGSLGSFSNLLFAGGKLSLIAASTGTTAQTLGNVSLGVKGNSSAIANGGTLTLNNSGATQVVNLGTLPGVSTAGVISSTLEGGSLNIAVTGAGTTTVTTTSKTDATGIYTGRTVYTSGSSTDWASSTSVSGPYVISGYTGYATLATSGTDTNNSRLQGTGGTTTTLAGNVGTNTLKIENPDVGDVLDLGSFNLSLTSGGLLKTGANAYSINNGTITSGLTSTGGTLNGNTGSPDSSDLVIHQYGTGTLTIGAQILDSGIGQASTLTKAGPGTLVLTGTNGYTGYTLVNGGILSISSDANLGGANGTISVASTSGSTATLANTVMALPVGFGVGSVFLGRTVTLISGSPGAYVVTLSGAATTVTNGLASYATDQALALNGGTLQVTSSVSMLQTNASGVGGTSTAARQIQLGSSGGTINVLNGSLFTVNAGLTTYVANSGYAGITIDANDGQNGEVLLNSNSGATFVGGVNINGGILFATFAGSLSANNNAINALTFGSGSEINPATGLTVNTTPTLILGSNQSFSSLNSPSTTTAVIKSNTSTGYLIIADGGVDSYSGLLTNGTGALGLTKGGSGTLSLTNTANAYTAITSIDSGVLNVAALANVNTVSSIGKGSSGGSAGDLFFGGGTLQYTGSAGTSTNRLFTIGDASDSSSRSGSAGNVSGNTATLDSSGSGTMSFTGTGSIAFVNTAAHTLTLSGTNMGANAFNPILGDQSVGNATNLVKDGVGSWTLGGVNTFTGSTVINAGTLSVGSTGSLSAGSAVSVKNSGTLAGNGTVNGAVSVESGGTIQGGDGTLGTTLTVAGNLSLSTGSVVNVVLGASGAHATLARSGGTWTFDPDQGFTVVESTPGAVVAGTFYDNVITGLSSDPGVTGWHLNNFVGTFSFDGNNVDLNVTAVPEPTAMGIMLLGAGSLLRRRRRRMT